MSSGTNRSQSFKSVSTYKLVVRWRNLQLQPSLSVTAWWSADEAYCYLNWWSTPRLHRWHLIGLSPSHGPWPNSSRSKEGGRYNRIKINTNEIMVHSLTGHHPISICIKGQDIKVVDRFWYLRRVVSADGDADVAPCINSVKSHSPLHPKFGNAVFSTPKPRWDCWIPTFFFCAPIWEYRTENDYHCSSSKPSSIFVEWRRTVEKECKLFEKSCKHLQNTDWVLCFLQGQAPTIYTHIGDENIVILPTFTCWI